MPTYRFYPRPSAGTFAAAVLGEESTSTRRMSARLEGLSALMMAHPPYVSLIAVGVPLWLLHLLSYVVLPLLLSNSPALTGGHGTVMGL